MSLSKTIIFSSTERVQETGDIIVVLSVVDLATALEVKLTRH